MYDIFLRHAVEDDELAGRVADLLRASNILVFTTGPGFPTGMWSEEVRAALEQCEHFWLLLTDKALDRSVYVHHEFGYFFGYHRQKEPSSEVRLIAKRLRYLVNKGDGRRPGMYQHFQDFPVDEFDDPVAIAKAIATEIGRPFTEPANPEQYGLSNAGWVTVPPEGLNDMKIVRASASAASDYSYGIITIDISTPKTIFNVSAVTWHPQVAVSPLKPLYQVGSGQKGQLSLRVQWVPGKQAPKELDDSLKRRYSLLRPRDPGTPWGPLYVTFETESGQLWAAVVYMRVERQQHGHPEAGLLYGPAPSGWVKGRKVAG